MKTYKKMAGTSAVFVLADYHGAAPIERDGLTWTASELHWANQDFTENSMPDMANVLALEGLEEYDPPVHGDVRYVTSLGVRFIYWKPVRGWIQTE